MVSSISAVRIQISFIPKFALYAHFLLLPPFDAWHLDLKRSKIKISQNLTERSNNSTHAYIWNCKCVKLLFSVGPGVNLQWFVKKCTRDAICLNNEVRFKHHAFECNEHVMNTNVLSSWICTVWIAGLYGAN